MALFKNPKILTNAAPQPKGRKKQRGVVEVEGIERLNHIDTAINILTTARNSIEQGVLEKIHALFMRTIKADGGGKPESFNGVEGLAEANFQLRKRSASSALNDEERKILAKAKIPIRKEIITPKLFAINPEYATDKKLIEKVEKALSKIVPADFIVMQEEKTKFIVDEACLEEALKTKNSEVVKLVTTLAIKWVDSDDRPVNISKTVKSVISTYLTPTDNKSSSR